jgi:hypothetical protein
MLPRERACVSLIFAGIILVSTGAMATCHRRDIDPSQLLPHEKSKVGVAPSEAAEREQRLGLFRQALAHSFARTFSAHDEKPNQPPQRNAGKRPFCGSALSSAWLI